MRNRLQPGNRVVAIGDENGFPALDPLDEAAELIFGSGDAGGFHVAKLAM